MNSGDLTNGIYMFVILVGSEQQGVKKIYVFEFSEHEVVSLCLFFIHWQTGEGIPHFLQIKK